MSTGTQREQLDAWHWAVFVAGGGGQGDAVGGFDVVVGEHDDAERVVDVGHGVPELLADEPAAGAGAALDIGEHGGGERGSGLYLEQ
jgi:hypothetical protein